MDFFKVYFSKFSSRRLKFPPAPVPYYERALSNNATLKDHNGKVWDVQLEKAESDLIITGGWQDFATHHSLADGDFLVFKYGGNSHFNVESYHANGFKRRKTSAIETASARVKEEEETETENKMSCSQPTSGHERKYSETPLKRAHTSGSLGGKRPKLSKITTRKVGKGKFVEAAPLMETKNPSFVKDITRYLNALTVPRSMVTDHNIKLNKEMKLRDENGKLWPVKLSFSKDLTARITSGWIDFCRAHKVSEGDKCIFEFIPKRGGVNKIMHVRVVRKKLKKR